MLFVLRLEVRQKKLARASDILAKKLSVSKVPSKEMETIEDKLLDYFTQQRRFADEVSLLNLSVTASSMCSKF